MFNDPQHADMQQLAAHHDAGTHDQIPAEQAAAAVSAFHEQADPALVQQVTDAHYEAMPAGQLRTAAQHFREKLQGIAGTSPEAARLAKIDPANATPQDVVEMHRFILREHPELMREILIGGGAALALGALAAFAAHRYRNSRSS